MNGNNKRPKRNNQRFKKTLAFRSSLFSSLLPFFGSEGGHPKEDDSKEMILVGILIISYKKIAIKITAAVHYQVKDSIKCPCRSKDKPFEF